jgi:hypothetical protein
MESQEYRNPFRDVHRKAKALKERAQEELKRVEELRKKKEIQETESTFESSLHARSNR